METLVHADAFFFITAIAVVVVGAGMLVVLFYLVALIREVRALVNMARETTEEFTQGARALREKGAGLVGWLFNMLTEKKGKKRSK